MNFGRNDGQYAEDYSSNDPSMGVSVNSNTSSLSPYLSIDPSYLQQGGGAEFVFPTDQKKTRTWGERMFSGIGSSYLTGQMLEKSVIPAIIGHWSNTGKMQPGNCHCKDDCSNAFVFPKVDKTRLPQGLLCSFVERFSYPGAWILAKCHGLVIGGSWGFSEGVRNPDGRTMKLRINSVLNGCTRRGPFVANSLGVLALMYSTLDYGIGKLRDKDDQYNSIAAAVTTGVIFKSTAGVRAVAVAAALGGSLALMYNMGEKLWVNKGNSVMSSPGWA